ITLIHARLLFADLLCERNNYRAAEDTLRLGIKYHPSDVGFHCFLGHIALSDRRLDEAERNYQRALTLAHDCAAAYTGLSSIRMLEDRYNDAIDQIKLALRYDGRASSALINLGIIHYAFNRREEAVEAFDRAIGIAPRAA